MTEDRQAMITVETVLDLPVWKEYCIHSPLTAAKNQHFFLLGTVLIIWCGFTLLLTPSRGISVLIGFAIGSIPLLIRWFRHRGDRWRYQDVLNQEGGKVPHIRYCFYEDEIKSYQKHMDSVSFYPYWRITEIYDCGTLLLLLLDTKKLMIMDSRWIQGGTRDELLSILRSKCTMAKKGIRKVSFWKILRLVMDVTLVLVFALAVIFSAIELHFPWNTNADQNELTYQGAAAILETLDIHCSKESIQEAEAWEADYQAFLEEISEELGYTPEASTPQDRIISLLCGAGCGIYDPDTWEWTPPDTGVYWLDMEALDISTMYTDYLRGLSAVSGGKLVITHIAESYEHVDFETYTGTISLSFTMNGENYQLTIPMDGDWYDVRSLDTINAILSTGENRVYALSDSGQGVLLFYRSRQWASQFKKTTGIPLMEKISSVWYGYPY